jgi:hypothetical protein
VGLAEVAGLVEVEVGLIRAEVGLARAEVGLVEVEVGNWGQLRPWLDTHQSI